MTAWSDHPQSAYGWLFLLKPRVVFKAKINLAAATYPRIGIPFDNVTVGAYTDIKPGMTVFIGQNGDDSLGRVRVRAAATSTVIPIGRASQGSGWGELNAHDNADIVVLDFHEVWSKTPFIDASGTSLKDEVVFSASIAQPPVANGGPAVVQWVDGSGHITVDFTSAQSVKVDTAIGNAGITSVAWNFGDGTPSTSTSATPTGVVFPAGFRYVSLTVSDGTRSHTTYIPVYAADHTGDLPPIPVKVSTRVLTIEGQSVSFTIEARDIDVNDYPYGTLAIYFEDEYYGNTRVSLAGISGRENVKFVGWLDTESNSITYGEHGGVSTVTLKALDVAGRLNKLSGFGQRIVNAATPTDWQHMKNACIDRYLHHLLHWHSTALEVAPARILTTGGLTWAFHDLASEGQSLYAQVDERATAVAARFTCTSYGELLVRYDDQRVDPAIRDSTVFVTIGDNDWNEVTYEATPQPTVRWLHGSAIIANALNALPVFAVSPGTTPGQGTEDRDVGNQLVTNADMLAIRTGLDYARANPKTTPYNLTLAHGNDFGLEPARRGWVKWSMSSTVIGKRQDIIPTNTLFQIKQTEITLNEQTHAKVTKLTLERLVNAFKAVLYTPPSLPENTPPDSTTPPDDTYPGTPEDPVVIFPPTYPPTAPPTTDGPNGQVLLASETHLAAILNYRKAVVNDADWIYADIVPELVGSETVRHALWSGFGPDAYCLVSDGTNSRLLYTETALASAPVWNVGDTLVGEYTRIILTDKQGKLYLQGTTELVPNPADAWSIYTGSEVSRTATTITGHSAFTGGTSYRVGLCATGYAGGGVPPDSLNRIVAVHLDTEGVDIAGVGWWLPGESGETTGLYGTQCIWNMDFVCTSAFDITYTFSTSDECGDGGLSGCVIYSADYGETFAAPLPTGYLGGGDTIKLGEPILLGGGTATKKNTTKGGALTDYGDPIPTGAADDLIVVPRFQFGSTSTINTGTSTPQYLLGSGVVTGSNEALWKVTGSGVVYNNITPTHSGDYGATVGPNGVAMHWRSGSKMAGVFSFAGDHRLMTSTNAGSAWTARTALAAECNYITMRKGDTTIKELYICNNLLAAYSYDFGASLFSKEAPIDGVLVSVDIYG